MRKYFEQFSVLKETKREYWGVQIVNFLDSLYAFAFMIVSTLFLTQSLGFDDIGAGAALSWLGIFTSICVFASGPLVDRIGLRKSLFVSLSIVTLIRSLMILTAFWDGMPARRWVFIGLMVLAGLPGSIKSTAYQIGNKRFTTEKSQSAGFNLWYIIMNVGALGAGLVVDFLHLGLVLGREWVLVLGLISAALCAITTWFMIRDDAQLGDTAAEAAATRAAKRDVSWVTYMGAVFRHDAFYRMIAAVTLTLGVRMVFLYWQLLSPKYWERTIGPDAAIGTLNAINPLVIIAGLIVLIPLINRFKTFDMLLRGSLFAAVSILPLAMPWQWFSRDVSTAYYTMSIISMILFSFGEIAFSPRLSQYILAIAPKGQEGIYASFAGVPYFIAKTAVGFLSGVMLTRWCPEVVQISGKARPLRDAIGAGHIPYAASPEMMWLVLAAAAVTGPLIMIPLRGWFVRGMKDDPTYQKTAA